MEFVTENRNVARPRWASAAIIVAALAVLAAIALAVFPFGMLRGTVERRLSASTGRPVTIASIARVDALSWTPTVAIRGVRIAGQGTDVARIREARVRFPVFPLLIGRFRPSAIDIVGMNLALVRDAAGNENWHAHRTRDAHGSRPALRHLTVRDSNISYRDARRDRTFDARFTVDAAGLRLAGPGTIRGEPVTLLASGPPIDGVRPGTPWPFAVRIDGPAIGMTLAGKMDGPLDIDHFTAAATGRARDLKLLDAIIEAGLPETQPVSFAGQVRRDAPEWRITGLHGTIGRSDLSGEGAVTRPGGRTLVTGKLSSNRFDFTDLANDAGRQRAHLKEARLGMRLLPDTEIDLDGFTQTDVKIDVSVRRLLWPGSSPFRSLAGTFTVDRSRLDVAPLTLGLTNGTMTGRISVDQRRGGPILDVAMAIEHARLIDVFPTAAIDGPLRGRIALAGPGRTIREGIGRSTGTVILVAHDGVIPARTASLLGQDLGRGITAGEDDLATLRCLIARLSVKDGIARPDPVLIDTSRALTRASGSIDLSDERLHIALSGAPKQNSLLRLTGSVPVGGTIEALDIRVPQQARSAGGILKMLGRAIAGENAPIATDLDCAAEAARVLGR